ncbi:cytochrome c oxidase subunit 5A, mitochondrial [Halyomorpha halys]|uniref:cytochrome c oxidase subunit 5A, mitochondrial n=1 Tax=Halyomorpha halys TaxID=286706 RepID=UPI0006D5128F|nr:cytochrome c oxidase subunit 5A, mitochondrial [Halyomorpha halys]
MFRALRILGSTKSVINSSQPVCIKIRQMSKVSTESDEEFDARYEAFFNNPSIDGWDVRKAMNDLCGMDLVPEPRIITAALKACRRVNDYALAIRFLEAVKFKCGPKVQEVYPYILHEIKPTLDELGIDTPEKLGYDKPELALSNVYDIH